MPMRSMPCAVCCTKQFMYIKQLNFHKPHIYIYIYMCMP